MKKFIIITVLLSLFLFKSNNDTIRFRVIANSNSEGDQLLKYELINNLSKELELITNSNDIYTTRKIITEKLPEIEKIVKETLGNDNYKINYGKNFFPQKLWKNKIYNEGEYESLVITIGEGKGDNFWCLLFPPLCLLEGEDEENNSVEYHTFIGDLLDRYFH